MSALFLLIGVSLVFAFGFLGAFLWAMNDRQFEDDHTPAVRMLFDDNMVVSSNAAPKQQLSNNEMVKSSTNAINSEESLTNHQ
jgi:cbb3-type cytochrome oxidase maturation protein